MYLRAGHAVKDIPFLQQFIRDNPLGILTTAIKSTSYPFLQSSHIPFLLDVPESNNGYAEDGGEVLGTLRGHMAKQNPQAKAIMGLVADLKSTTNTNTTDDGKSIELPDEVLVLFNSPYHHYVTPKFYTATKPATGKVVPTWNYSAVQAYGKIRVFCDSKAEETSTFLQTQVEDLSRFSETSIMGYEEPWKVDDAPENYVGLLKKNIIGIEIQLERLQGKVKMSQEMPVGDREGVVEGFEKLESDAGRGMAGMVKERM